MKKAIIIIRPNCYRKTIESLKEAGFNAFSSVNVQGRGKKSVMFTAADDSENSGTNIHRFMTKKMIVIYLNDIDEKAIVNTVLSTNKRGNEGDGKIFIIPLQTALRIRTGEKNEDAIV
jgi:nitrogen regulatory protein PII 2